MSPWQTPSYRRCLYPRITSSLVFGWSDPLMSSGADVGVGIEAEGIGVFVGLGVLVASGVIVGLGVLVASGVPVGLGVLVASGVVVDGVGVSVAVVAGPLMTVGTGVGVSVDTLPTACSSESDCEHASTARSDQVSAQRTEFVWLMSNESRATSMECGNGPVPDWTLLGFARIAGTAPLQVVALGQVSPNEGEKMGPLL